MKTALRISLLLNLALAGSLIFFLANQRKAKTASASISPKAETSVPTPAASAAIAASRTASKPFRWRQLESASDYRGYVAKLHAIGCPEPTIEDIVRGDAARAFSWERHHLRLDGSGTGPWSRHAEMQLIASLLGAPLPTGTKTVAQYAEVNGGANKGAESTAPEQPAVNRRRGGGIGVVAEASVPFPGAGTESPSYPLFLQNPNWKALGFTAGQQAAIARVRQQFLNEVSSLDQNGGNAANPDSSAPVTGNDLRTPDPSDPAALSQWQKALQNADQVLQGLLGTQAYMIYEQQQYYAWYQPQVAAAVAGGGPLIINPAASP